MADGSSIKRGPYGAEVRQAIEFLVGLVEKPPQQDVQVPEGYFAYPQGKHLSAAMHAFLDLARRQARELMRESLARETA